MRRNSIKRQLWAALSALLVFAAFLFVWELILLLSHVPPYMLPSPWRVAHATLTRFAALTHALALTATAATGGLLASILVGVCIAVVFARSRSIRRLFYPYTVLLQTVPIVAIAPLILMWVGAGLGAVTLIAFIICLAPIIANTTQGLISVDENLLNLFRMQNATRGQLLWKLQLPHALPSLFTGIRIAGGISVIGAITGELFAGSSKVGQGGLGYSIIYASEQLETDYLFALIAAATLLGFCFYFIVSLLEWTFLHTWHESARGGEEVE